MMILPCVYISETEEMGRGVFTSENIKKGTVIEESPVIVMTNGERKLVDQTILHDYIFEWGEKKNKCCMALGYIAVYNHSYKSNCEYEMDFVKKTIIIRAVHFIKAGEELFVNYNGNWNDTKPVWFDTK